MSKAPSLVGLQTIIVLLKVRWANVEISHNTSDPSPKKDRTIADAANSNPPNTSNPAEDLAKAINIQDDLIAQISSISKQMAVDSTADMSGAWAAIMVHENEVMRATEKHGRFGTIRSKLSLVGAQERLARAMDRYGHLRENVWRQTQKILRQIEWNS